MTTTCADVPDSVARFLREALADGRWQLVAELQKTISNDLAEARCDQTSPLRLPPASPATTETNIMNNPCHDCQALEPDEYYMVHNEVWKAAGAN